MSKVRNPVAANNLGLRSGRGPCTVEVPWPLLMSRALARIALLLALCAIACTATPEVGGARPLHLVVLHTNDVHGQVLPRAATWLDRDEPPLVGGLARVGAYVNRVRAEVAEEGGALLVVDAGDWFQGTPEGLIGDGLPFLEAMARIGYDGMCVGNHEFDHGTRVLAAHLAEARPPALLANVADASGRTVRGARRFAVVVRGGLRIALVGLLTTVTPEITHASTRALTFTDPAAALTDVQAELAGEVDWFLPLTHLGVDGDRALARAHPELDLIVGGHSHTYLAEGVREGGTLIVQTGSKASGVGRVDLWFDPVTNEVLRAEARVVDLLEAPAPPWADAELEAACDSLVARSAALMDEVVGQLAAPLTRTRDPIGESTAGNLITDAMRARASADVALQNRGGIRADVPAGPVTRRALFEILPFGNHLVTLDLSGAELAATLRKSFDGGHSGLDLSGASVEVRGEGSGLVVARIFVDGRPLDERARYRVVTNSFMAGGGDGYELLAGVAEREVDPILLREMLEEIFREQGTVTPAPGSRYLRVP